MRVQFTEASTEDDSHQSEKAGLTVKERLTAEFHSCEDPSCLIKEVVHLLFSHNSDIHKGVNDLLERQRESLRLSMHSVFDFDVL